MTTETGNQVRMSWPVPEGATALRVFRTDDLAHLTPQEARYHSWRYGTQAGIEVFSLFERYALELASRGKRFGFRLIAERVRWELMVTRSEEEWAVNNSYVPFLAREIVAKHPAMARLVEFRHRVHAEVGA